MSSFHDFRYWLNKGLIALQQEKHREAIDHLLHALEYDPKQLMIWSILSAAYIAVGEYDNAIEILTEVLKFNTQIQNKEDLPKHLYNSFPQEQRESAINKLSNALEPDSNYEGPWEAVAGYFVYKEEYGKAIEAYQRALKKNPKNPMPYINLYSIYMKKKEYKTAIEMTEKALEIVPNFKSAMILLGIAHLENGDIEKAKNICKEILQSDPLLGRASELRKRILEKMGKSKDEFKFEKYEGIPLWKNQKEFLVDLENIIGEPIPPTVNIRIEPTYGSFGFSSKAGYITGLGLYTKFFDMLPESIGNLKYLKKIDLSHNFVMKKLPENIIKLEHLEELKFMSFPLDLNLKICKLDSLKKLDISDSSNITALPECLAELSDLEEICIGGCYNLTDIPEIIQKKFTIVSSGAYRTLKKLEVPPKPFKRIEENNVFELYEDQKVYIKELVPIKKIIEQTYQPLPIIPNRKITRNGLFFHQNHIVELKLINLNNLNTLPEEIRNLTHLEHLTLEKCSLIQSLPENIGELTSLRNLTLRECNSLTHLPDTLGNLSKLDQLTLMMCQKLGSLPNTLGNLHSLKKIWIYGCSNLKSLPNSIGTLKSLEEIEFQFTDSLEVYPLTLNECINLKIIKVDRNKTIEELPEGIASSPYIRNLKLYYLPKLNSLGNIGKAKSLKNLEIIECPSLKQIPDTIGNLKNLERLIIEKSGLVSLTSSLGHLISLKELKVSVCLYLESIICNFTNLKNLRKLEISNCGKFEIIPESIGNLSNIEEIIISGCNITNIPESIANLKTLRTLNIQNNRLSVLNIYKDEKISDLQALKKLSLLAISRSYKTIYDESLEYLEKLIRKIWESNNYKEDIFDALQFIVSSNQFAIIREKAIILIIELFGETGKDFYKILVERESAVLVLATLYSYLKQNSSLKYLARRLMNRLSKLFLAIPEESEVIFDIEIAKLQDDKERQIQEEFFNLHGTYSIEELTNLQTMQENKPYYAIENGHIVALNISGLGLCEIPESFKKLRNIRNLNLSFNKLDRIPDWFDLFSNLVSLDISHNSLITFPKILSRLHSLKNLNIHHNQIIQEVPDVFISVLKQMYINQGVNEDETEILSHIEQHIGCKLLKLNRLSPPNQISNAQHYKLDDHGRVIGLYIHDIEKFMLNIIPRQLFKLKYLQELDLADNNYITVIPDSIKNLEFLEFLNLRNSSISLIPESLVKLNNLEYLDLSGNQIGFLPDKLGELQSLTFLNLSNNNIKVIPSSIKNLTLLSYLGLDNNDISKIPEKVASLKDLKELYLSFNKIQEIPQEISELSSLEILSLSANKIQTIPSNINHLKSLRKLMLMSNKIIKVPASMIAMENLEFLDLSNNNLEEVPEFLGEIKSLHHLDLSYNNLEPHPQLENKIRNFVMKEKKNHDDLMY